MCFYRVLQRFVASSCLIIIHFVNADSMIFLFSFLQGFHGSQFLTVSHFKELLSGGMSCSYSYLVK